MESLTWYQTFLRRKDKSGLYRWPWTRGGILNKKKKKKATFGCLWNDKSDTSYSSWGASCCFNSLLPFFSSSHPSADLSHDKRLLGHHTGLQIHGRSRIPPPTHSQVLSYMSPLELPYPTIETHRLCFNFSVSFYHRRGGGKHSKKSPGQSIW